MVSLTNLDMVDTFIVCGCLLPDAAAKAEAGLGWRSVLAEEG